MSFLIFNQIVDLPKEDEDLQGTKDEKADKDEDSDEDHLSSDSDSPDECFDQNPTEKWIPDGSVSNLVACLDGLAVEDFANIKEAYCVDPSNFSSACFHMTAKAIQFQGHSFRKWKQDIMTLRLGIEADQQAWLDAEARVKKYVSEGSYPCGKIKPCEQSDSSSSNRSFGWDWEHIHEKAERWHDYFSWSFLNTKEYSERELESVRFCSAVYIWSQGMDHFDPRFWNTTAGIGCRSAIAKAIKVLFQHDRFSFLAPENKQARVPGVFYVPDFRVVEGVQKERISYGYIEYMRKRRPASVTSEMTALWTVFDLGFRLSHRTVDELMVCVNANKKEEAYNIWNTSKRSFARAIHVGEALTMGEQETTELRRNMYSMFTPQMIRGAEVALFTELERLDLVEKGWSCVDEDALEAMDRKFSRLNLSAGEVTNIMVEQEIKVEGQLVPIQDTVFGSLVSGLKKHLSSLFQRSGISGAGKGRRQLCRCRGLFFLCLRHHSRSRSFLLTPLG